MIVNIRGTSGSGKSTIVKKIIEQAISCTFWSPDWCQMVSEKPINEKTGKPKNRKQPWGYRMSLNGAPKQVVVLGHYETACGGCDSISGLDLIYEMALNAESQGFDVLFEGLIINSDFKRAANFATVWKDKPFKCLFLSTPLDLCISSVNQRRAASPKAAKLAAKGETLGDVDPTNTKAKFDLNLKMIDRLAKAGVDARWVDRDACLKEVLESFGALPVT